MQPKAIAAVTVPCADSVSLLWLRPGTPTDSSCAGASGECPWGSLCVPCLCLLFQLCQCLLARSWAAHAVEGKSLFLLSRPAFTQAGFSLLAKIGRQSTVLGLCPLSAPWHGPRAARRALPPPHSPTCYSLPFEKLRNQSFKVLRLLLSHRLVTSTALRCSQDSFILRGGHWGSGLTLPRDLSPRDRCVLVCFRSAWGPAVPKPGGQGVLAAVPKLSVLPVGNVGKARWKQLSWLTHLVNCGLQGEPGWPGPFTSFFPAKCHLNICHPFCSISWPHPSGSTGIESPWYNDLLFSGFFQLGSLWRTKLPGTAEAPCSDWNLCVAVTANGMRNFKDCLILNCSPQMCLEVVYLKLVFLFQFSERSVQALLNFAK